MIIETKYNRGDWVWVMIANEPRRWWISFFEIKSGNLAGLPDPYVVYFLAKSAVPCCNDGGIHHESKLFETKEALLKSYN